MHNPIWRTSLCCMSQSGRSTRKIHNFAISKTQLVLHCNKMTMAFYDHNNVQKYTDADHSCTMLTLCLHQIVILEFTSLSMFKSSILLIRISRGWSIRMLLILDWMLWLDVKKRWPHADSNYTIYSMNCDRFWRIRHIDLIGCKVKTRDILKTINLWTRCLY